MFPGKHSLYVCHIHWEHLFKLKNLKWSKLLFLIFHIQIYINTSIYLINSLLKKYYNHTYYRLLKKHLNHCLLILIIYLSNIVTYFLYTFLLNVDEFIDIFIFCKFY
jgi:hypothetical protein